MLGAGCHAGCTSSKTSDRSVPTAHFLARFPVSVHPSPLTPSATRDTLAGPAPISPARANRPQKAMRSIPPASPLLVAALLVVALLAVSSDSPSPAGAIEVEPVIWQLDTDYPGVGDAGLPVSTVYIKTHDGSDWMSTYDDHPRAVSGPASIRQLITDYAAQGIEVAAWFVPYGLDFDAQVQRAIEVIDSGVKALYADLEPFQGFCYQDCHALAENFWYRVRAARPDAPPRRHLRPAPLVVGSVRHPRMALRSRLRPPHVLLGVLLRPDPLG